MTRLVDLSHPIEQGMTTYPGLPGPVIETHLERAESRHHYDAGTEFHIGRIEMVANTGTYLDVPFHRYRDGYDIADLPVERCANLPGVCVASTDRAIGPDLFDGIEIAGRAVLIHTGWDQHWRTDRYGDPAHPHLTADAAKVLTRRDVALVGIDSVNIDATQGGTRPAHSTLLAAGIPIVEHLTNLEGLVGAVFRFFAVPAPVRGMGTFPIRALALLD
ncbi:MAG TPA: cyclase family protein [Acidimicrobiia bacterium]|nr:cyclase family protein [Acidimicrobiia bacterium]